MLVMASSSCSTFNRSSLFSFLSELMRLRSLLEMNSSSCSADACYSHDREMCEIADPLYVEASIQTNTDQIHCQLPQSLIICSVWGTRMQSKAMFRVNIRTGIRNAHRRILTCPHSISNSNFNFLINVS